MIIKTCAVSLLRKFNNPRGLQLSSLLINRLFQQRNFTQWDIFAALSLERKPVITQSLTPLEQKYLMLMQQMEFEKSYLSDHEKRHKMDKIIAEKLKKGDLENMEEIPKQTAQDFEDASLDEFNRFKFAPRITKADINNDRQSLQRKLDSTLLLLIEQKLGNDYRWILPQTIHLEGETLRQTAERILTEVISKKPKVQFLGNAPVGFYKYKYPKLLRGNGVLGAKVFFFKAYLLDTKEDKLEINQTEDLRNHLWLAPNELQEVLQPVYCKAVQSFIFPDTLSTDELVSQIDSSEDDEREVASSTALHQ